MSDTSRGNPERRLPRRVLAAEFVVRLELASSLPIAEADAVIEHAARLLRRQVREASAELLARGIAARLTVDP